MVEVFTLLEMVFIILIFYFLNYVFLYNSILMDNLFLLSSGLPICATKRLKKIEKQKYLLTSELKQILVGLILGDLYLRRRKINRDVSIHFKQGLLHKEYIEHLYDLFKTYCPSTLKYETSLPDKRTGNIYTTVYFTSFTLPCFNEYFDLFYKSSIKVIPNNIGDLLTPISLAY
jgi:LAGLIDADG DNA endonuclease family